MNIQREDEITITVEYQRRLYRRYKANGKWEMLCSYGWESCGDGTWKAGILEFEFGRMKND